MTDAEPLFTDTNILIYANVATAPLHEPALNAIKAHHQAGRAL
jgi:predicted nucleic acid-binding protein